MLQKINLFKYFILLSLFLVASINPVAALPHRAIQKSTPTVEDLSRKSVEKKLGRKLKLKERLALWVLRKKLKKKEQEKEQVKWSWVPFLALFVMALSIPVFFMFESILISSMMFGLGMLISAIGTLDFYQEKKKKGKFVNYAVAVLGGILTFLGVGLYITIKNSR